MRAATAPSPVSTPCRIRLSAYSPLPQAVFRNGVRGLPAVASAACCTAACAFGGCRSHPCRKKAKKSGASRNPPLTQLTENATSKSVFQYFISMSLLHGYRREERPKNLLTCRLSGSLYVLRTPLCLFLWCPGI